MPDDDDSDAKHDGAWDHAREGESEAERLDRNWNDLLQELRVVQTGVQLLTGFLLTLPFQQRFGQLDEGSRNVYLATIAAAIVATAALVAPVSIHRVLFRRHARRSMVAVSHRCAQIGITMLGVAVCGVVDVMTTIVLSDRSGTIAAGIAALLFLAAWAGVPLYLREKRPEPDP